MKDRKITNEEKMYFSKRQESHFYDRKAKEIGGKKIQKIAVAFANADGGDFIVGIKDDKDEPDFTKRWAGELNKEAFNEVFQNLIEISPSIPYSPEFLLDESSNTYALRITIEKSDKVHFTADKIVYQRISAQSIPIKEPQKIQELAFAKGESSYEDIVLEDARAEDIFETFEMKRFLRDYSPKSDAIDFTINQNLVDRNKYSPKIAGLLLFNDNPVTLLPRKCGIKITRYDTSIEIPERTHLKEQFSIEGNLYSQINDASQKISEIMSNVKIWTPKGLEKVDYPPETIWEILVNAVIHRDYSISDDVQILIFNNRIEIISPGKLPGYVTIDNILDARFSRNTKIVRTLNRYKNPPNKDMGEGLNTAFQKMQEWHLKKPTISINGNYVKVTIAHSPLASPEESVLEYLSHNSIVKNREAREITGIKSENVMKNVFIKMRQNNLIEPVMSKTGTKIIAWKKK
ncbi:MAG: transcriptional regulator [Bacteroidales bacterium]|nr:MAG: transcriptional regulator [Bacteroidales bacterium]